MNWFFEAFERLRALGPTAHEAKELSQDQFGIPADESRKLSVPLFESTIARVTAALRKIPAREKLSILLFTSRPEYFDPSDLFDGNQSAIKSVLMVDNEDTLQACKDQFDIAIVCTHIRREHKAQLIIRQNKLAPLVLVWCFDNHHSFYANLQYNSLADIVLPGHFYCGHKLKTPHALLGRSFALPTAQWSRSLASRLLIRDANSRSDALSGGYTLWSVKGPRNDLLRRLKTCLPGNALRLMDESDRTAYFSLSREERFKQWTKYKVSLALPLLHDLSFRVFDALIAGQIPIVPTNCYDLDMVIPPDIQQVLPIIRIGELSPESVEEAWHAAIERFNQGKIQGIVARHEYARDHHHVSFRINGIAEYIREISKKKISVLLDDSGVGLLAGCLQPGSPPPSAVTLDTKSDLAIPNEKVWNGAATVHHDSGVRVTTDSAPWSYAAESPLQFGDEFVSGGWYWADVLIEVLSGQISVGILTSDGRLKGERLVSKKILKSESPYPFCEVMYRSSSEMDRGTSAPPSICLKSGFMGCLSLKVPIPDAE